MSSAFLSVPGGGPASNSTVSSSVPAPSALSSPNLIISPPSPSASSPSPSPLASPVPSVPSPSLAASPLRPSESIGDIALRDEEKKNLIRRINSDQSLTMQEKHRKIQEIMMQGARVHLSPMSRHVPEHDRVPSFFNEENKELGCPHYRRGCKIKAPCCSKIYPCRLCHNEDADHEINRFAISEMLCMYCFQLQPVAQLCRNPECKKVMALYYCRICKLFDDFPDRDIFHCDKCGICRRGKQSDFFHCLKCNICLHNQQANNHTCIERSLESNCPICSQWLFTSTIPVFFMKCGHPIHVPCFNSYSRTNFVCPLCNKSLFPDDVLQQLWQQMERDRARQPMPSGYCKWRARILCNDCLVESDVDYHFVYNKCHKCNGYNTKLVNTMKRDPTAEEIKEHEARSLVTIQAFQEQQPQEQSWSDNDEPLNAENAVSLMHGSPSLPPSSNDSDMHPSPPPFPSNDSENSP